MAWSHVLTNGHGDSYRGFYTSTDVDKLMLIGIIVEEVTEARFFDSCGKPTLSTLSIFFHLLHPCVSASLSMLPGD